MKRLNWTEKGGRIRRSWQKEMFYVDDHFIFISLFNISQIFLKFLFTFSEPFCSSFSSFA